MPTLLALGSLTLMSTIMASIAIGLPLLALKAEHIAKGDKDD